MSDLNEIKLTLESNSFMKQCVLEIYLFFFFIICMSLNKLCITLCIIPAFNTFRVYVNVYVIH